MSFCFHPRSYFMYFVVVVMHSIDAYRVRSKIGMPWITNVQNSIKSWAAQRRNLHKDNLSHLRRHLRVFLCVWERIKTQNFQPLLRKIIAWPFFFFSRSIKSFPVLFYPHWIETANRPKTDRTKYLSSLWLNSDRIRNTHSLAENNGSVTTEWNNNCLASEKLFHSIWNENCIHFYFSWRRVLAILAPRCVTICAAGIYSGFGFFLLFLLLSKNKVSMWTVESCIRNTKNKIEIAVVWKGHFLIIVMILSMRMWTVQPPLPPWRPSAP